ncbi:hypothetical protein [Mycobacterium phage WXIN]|nr:hypothetical protein [Mycobacterium phage WXIN]
MTELYEFAPPDGVEVIIEWLSALGIEVRDERPAGAPLPFIMVHDLGGPDDGLVSKGVYSIHVFAETKPDAQALSMQVMRRLRLLARPFGGQQQVTISTGDVYVDNVSVVERPREVELLDSGLPRSVYRYVGTYRVELRYAAVS